MGSALLFSLFLLFLVCTFLVLSRETVITVTTANLRHLHLQRLGHQCRSCRPLTVLRTHRLIPVHRVAVLGGYHFSPRGVNIPCRGGCQAICFDRHSLHVCKCNRYKKLQCFRLWWSFSVESCYLWMKYLNVYFQNQMTMWVLFKC